MNFDTLYDAQTLSKWGLPSPVADAPAEGEFRRPLLRWKDMSDPAKGKAPPIRVVCCDVLRLDDIAAIDRATFIFARRIELSGRGALAIDRVGRPDMAVVVATQEIVRDGVAASLACTVAGPGPKDEAESKIVVVHGPEGAPTVSAFRLGADGRFAVTEPAQAAADLLYDGSPLALLLRSQFQIATLVFTQERALACALVAWVGTLAGGSARFSDLAAEARTMLGRLEALGRVGAGTSLVPRLDHTLYARQAKAMVATLRDRAAAMEKFRTAAEDDARWIEDVKATLADKTNEADLARELERIAEDALETASKARVMAAVAVRAEAEGLPPMRIDFERGIENWKKDEQFKAVVDIVTGVIEIAAQLPAVFVAGPQIMAMPAVKTVTGTLEGIAQGAAELLKSNPPSHYVPPDGRGGTLKKVTKTDLLDDIDALPPARSVKIGGSPPVQGEPRRSILLDDEDDIPSPRNGSSSSGGSDTRSVIGVENNVPKDKLDSPDIKEIGSIDEAMTADFVVIDSAAIEDDWVRLDGLSNDPSQDFVIVKPSKKAADYAKVYNMQLKERAAREKKSADAQKSLVDAAKSIGKSGKGIFDAAMRIVEVARKAEKLEAESIETLMRVDLAVDEAFGSIAPRGIDVVTGGAQLWGELEAEINRSFEAMGELRTKVAGAASFQFAILRLVRKGRAMSEARLALAQANADLAAARLRRRAAGRAAQIFETRLMTLANAAQKRAAMEMLAFDRVLDAKRAAWLAMEAYERAFYFFTLNHGESDDRAPMITADPQDFDRRARRMGETWVTSARLAAPPQEFSLGFVLQADDLPARLAAAKGVYTFDYAADDPWFSVWHRIRVREVEARVLGLNRAEPVLIDVATSGAYADRMLDGSVAPFVSDPFRISVLYDPRTDRVITPGRVDDRMANDFFQPTPFTTWRLTIQDKQGGQIPFSGATGIYFGIKGVWSRRP